MASEGSSSTLEYTPTWVVAGVCSVIVIISLVVERGLHYLGKFLKHKGQKALFGALEKLKEELMLLGFISLLLTVFQSVITHICIPESLSLHMLPCKKEATISQENHLGLGFSVVHNWSKRKLLSADSDSNFCNTKGEVPLLSLEALHQLHIFIFVLAVVHVAFSATTVILGGAKIRQWRNWELEIHKEIPKQEEGTIEHHHHHHHHLHHLEFVTEHVHGYWRQSAVISWMMAFFKQFHASVSKSDYRALREGFIMKHCQSNPKFDFYKYMMRALEDDFKRVVGISWYLWLFVVIFLLLNLNGWHTYFWLSFLPLLLLLIVGAKLEHIITRLAQDLAKHHLNQVEGAPNLRPSDEHFWFHWPGLVLYLLHFILFQNSFEIAFFFWIWSTYGFNSCIMGKTAYLIPRLVIGVIIQGLCSYSTLPLYAIVTQMGDMFKRAVFKEHLQTTLHGWALGARKKNPASSLFPSLPSLDRRKQKPDLSGEEPEVQMQRMEFEYSETSHNIQQPAELEGIMSVIGNSPTHSV
ncbi:MLO-like protein 13 isoform X1 [Typha angustifolia]|uniref:MLO-like protein 13 isoform X1 n=1 Tax=Typha angustifolia TaxID=59011 RepID=UPI003C2F1CDA